MDDTDRIARLERLVESQQRELDEQRRTITSLTAMSDTSRSPVVPAPRSAPEGVSRRDVLRRALVAGGAVVAGSAALAVSDAGPAAAADGDTLKAGQQTTAESSTVLLADAAASAYTYGIAAVTDTSFSGFTNQPFSFGAVTGIRTHGDGVGTAGYGSAIGVLAASDGGTALYATGATALQATGASGVVASSYSSYALSAITTANNDSSAIYAQAHGYGAAIEAHGPPSGTALVAYGTSAFLGRTYFALSGSTRVRGTRRRPLRAAGVTGVQLTKASKVLATIQGDSGAVGIAGVTLNVAKKSFVITLTGKVARTVTIAWMVID